VDYNCIIFDIDGTLSDPEHRRHFVKTHPKDWESFFKYSINDPEHEPVTELARLCYSKLKLDIILCTGREEDNRGVTITWLENHCINFKKLYMRKAGDFRRDDVIKFELLNEIYADGYKPLLVVDDRDVCVDMWRSHGLTCLQARAWQDLAPRQLGSLTLMVAPSGAGKTTWLASKTARDQYGIKPSQVVSSDEIREQFCGNIQNQSKNDEVFETLHKLVKERLILGLDTIVDATNIRNKDRKELINLVPGVKVRYIVLNRSMFDKYRDGGWRNEVGVDFMLKHEQTFQSNLKDILNGDGYDNVEVIDLRG
jgi:hypothetical protein